MWLRSRCESARPKVSSVSDPATLSVGTGPDALVLKISEDAYQGDAQYTVSVDGVRIGGPLTAQAAHATGQSDTVTVHGDWAAGNHVVSVNFLNDAYGGAGLDRNLHVDAATYNGSLASGADLDLFRNEAKSFSFTDDWAL